MDSNSHDGEGTVVELPDGRLAVELGDVAEDVGLEDGDDVEAVATEEAIELRAREQ